jgi:hypothetical protein
MINWFRFSERSVLLKKTSIHLNRKSALAGVETRKDYLLLNIKSDHPIKNPPWQKPSRFQQNDFITKCEFPRQKISMKI